MFQFQGSTQRSNQKGQDSICLYDIFGCLVECCGFIQWYLCLDQEEQNLYMNSFFLETFFEAHRTSTFILSHGINQ